MYYINDYIHWCIDNNKTYTELITLQIQHTPDNIKKYCKFIEDHYKNTEYTSSLLLFENWFHNSKNAKLITPELYNTLRMTITTE